MKKKSLEVRKVRDEEVYSVAVLHNFRGPIHIVVYDNG